jgi:hypothetical protein
LIPGLSDDETVTRCGTVIAAIPRNSHQTPQPTLLQREATHKLCFVQTAIMTGLNVHFSAWTV